jgi:fatty-acyl-CoA synthase
MMRATSNWLQAHASFRPDALAVIDADNGRTWTYAQLHDESVRWAGLLHHEHEVEPGDVVAVLAHNRGETLALLFACAQLGAVLQPLNWRLSLNELTWQLQDSRAVVLLTDAAHPVMGAARIEDGPGDVAFRGPGSELSDPWVLMYTSGTTGRPKGALLSHRQLHWNSLNTVLACDLTADDVTLTFTPLFHTGGLNCLTTPLLHRGGTVILTRGVDPAQALGLIAEHGVSLLMGVPTIFQMLADHPDFETTELGSVRDALCGGAPLGAPLLERYLDRGIPLRQGFGMTEVGPNCFSMPAADVRRKLNSVGKPIPHVAMRLVRPDGTDCDVDEPGELLLGGPAVFNGYLNRPDANAACLVDGWFHTGDVLAVDDEGFYRVAGRLKEMFISGGENVYPAEVEAALAELPQVGQVAVVGVPDARWGEVGRAFIEPAAGEVVDHALLTQHLDGRLARFKVPKHWLITNALPRTASGKIDKTALAQLPLEA